MIHQLVGIHTKYFYRVFDTKASKFDGPAMYMGSADNAPGIVNLEYQEDGRVVMYTDQYIYAEIRIDGVGNYIEFELSLARVLTNITAVSRLIM